MSAYSGPIVDIDVHNRPVSDAELAAYLPAEWREYGEACLANGLPLVKLPTGALVGILDGYGHRMDSYPEDGTPSGSSYEYLRDQWLDPAGITRAVLTHDTGEYPLHRNYDFAVALCRAANDWMIDRWLSRDDRLYAGISTAAATPVQAAEEIRRHADNPRMACVLVVGNALGLPLGHPVNHPIFEAAAETGRPILTHPHDRGEVGGTPGTQTESLAQGGLRALVDISSLIVHGVFEQHPGLRVVITEFGFTWLPSLMAQLDASYESLKLESRWVRRLPSDYIREHVRLGTQPLEAGGGRDSLIQLLETVDGVEDILCFSSDYPHFSMDDVDYVARTIPAAWHRKLFVENACAAFGWTPPPAPVREVAAVVGA